MAVGKVYMKNILTVAGYDPSSGAGIVRDMDTFFSLGMHGLSAPTCSVVQGPGGVVALNPTPGKLFKEIIAIVGKEIPLHGIKVGVACDAYYVREIVHIVKLKRIPLVIDPVITAKNGLRLITDAGLGTMIARLFPLATVVTPNIDEASLISGMKITKEEHMEEAARAILEKGPKAVVVKGGHLRGDPVDIFFDGEELVRWKKRRLNRVIHGTGCSFSASMISCLVAGCSPKDAFFASEKLMHEMLKESYRIDKQGYFYISTGIMNHIKLRERTGTKRP